MAALDLTRLTRPDAVVALRSYASRFRAAIRPTDDPETEELAEQIGPDGHAALDHVVAAANTFVLLGRALHSTLYGDQPTLHAAVTDPARRDWPEPGLSVEAALDRLDEEAAALAAAVERAEPRAWKRTARVAGGGEIVAFDVVREAVRAGAEHLRDATAAVAAARARRP